MLELMLGSAPAIKDSGPGPQKLATSYSAGPNKLTGFYGRVADGDFLSYSDLQTAIPVSGTPRTSVGWMKMHLDGKVLFIPRQCVAVSVQWNDIYQRGAMYGVDGPGIYYDIAPVNQYRTLTVKGYVFLVRCLKGAPNNPVAIANSSVIDSALTRGSEYDRLILNMTSNSSSNREGPIFDYQFNDSVYQHVANYSTAAFSGQRYTLSRRTESAVAMNPSFSSPSWGWLPVLELLGKA